MGFGTEFLRKFIQYTYREFHYISFGKLFFLCLIATLCLHLVFSLLEKKGGKKFSVFNRVFWFLLVNYSLFLLEVTIFHRDPGSRSRVVNLASAFSGNWRSQYMYYFLNILLFVPYGGCLEGLLHHRGKWLRLFLPIVLGLTTTLAVEITQLVTRRGFFEMADLEMNALGAVVGTFLMAFILGIVTFVKNRWKGKKHDSKGEGERPA